MTYHLVRKTKKTGAPASRRGTQGENAEGGCAEGGCRRVDPTAGLRHFYYLIKVSFLPLCHETLPNSYYLRCSSVLIMYLFSASVLFKDRDVLLAYTVGIVMALSVDKNASEQTAALSTLRNG